MYWHMKLLGKLLKIAFNPEKVITARLDSRRVYLHFVDGSQLEIVCDIPQDAEKLFWEITGDSSMVMSVTDVERKG